MSRAQAESVIKNIIREIAQECVSKGQAVSETLVAFMVIWYDVLFGKWQLALCFGRYSDYGVNILLSY